MRILLPGTRWSLTPPFHPYLKRGSLFSAALSLRFFDEHVPSEESTCRNEESGRALPVIVLYGARKFSS